MRTSITTAMPEPQLGAGGDGDAAFTLSRLLPSLVSDSSCFCCGSSTELMLDGGGVLFVRCPECGAEIEVEETVCERRSEPVLQAA